MAGDRAALSEVLRKGLDLTVSQTTFDALGKKYTVKVRDNYTTNDGRRYIVVTDRISAFDHIVGTLPFKGQLLTSIAAFWFEKTKDIAPNHVISSPDPQVMETV